MKIDTQQLLMISPFMRRNDENWLFVLLKMFLFLFLFLLFKEGPAICFEIVLLKTIVNIIC